MTEKRGPDGAWLIIGLCMLALAAIGALLTLFVDPGAGVMAAGAVISAAMWFGIGWLAGRR